MVRIGITGGIGSGKTYVCQIMERMGIPVYYCDSEAKRLMSENPEIRCSLTGLLGSNVYLSDGALNKKLLSDYIFADKQHTLQINRIVHPVVKRDFLDFVCKQDKTIRFCALESAILFESGFRDVVDVAVLVDAPWSLRLQRAMLRDAATKEQIEARMRSQMADEDRRRQADFCICNDETEDLEDQVKKLLERL